MLEYTLKKDNRRPKSNFKKAAVEKMKQEGLSKNNKIIDYMWLDDPDKAAIIERMIILNIDANKYYEIFVEWGQSSYIRKLDKPFNY